MNLQFKQSLLARGRSVNDSLMPESDSDLNVSHLLGGQRYHSIADVDRMPAFFMTLIGADDHWMFIASNGALTCGRHSPDRALFPYYTSDKLLDMVGVTGPKTMIQFLEGSKLVHWQPWNLEPSSFEIHRSLHKSFLGNRICFEEHNLTLGMTFRYSWSMSPRYGFVRSAELINHGATPRRFRVLDGLLNVLPSDLEQHFQLRFSNLADAYKKAELHTEGRLGVYYLSSIPTDCAHPNEGLRASTVWHDLSEPYQVLLSNRQLRCFQSGQEVQSETDIRGQRGAFLTVRQLELDRDRSCRWNLVAEVYQDHSGVAQLQKELTETPADLSSLEGDLAEHDEALLRLASQVDGIQVGRDSRRTDRHLSNSLFNAMRGGLPVNGYEIDRVALSEHLQTVNRHTSSQHGMWLRSLPDKISTVELQEQAKRVGDPDLVRICSEYLPLTFGRRHGDPTRPWNSFKIDIKRSDGSRKIGYQGNWRDVFQNWEALATSYPLFLPSMIRRFVNATTMDGYNPYRLDQSGFDWERLDPADAWANIGYWGDHQIVYLLKLMELAQNYLPGMMDSALADETFVYANVPYRIRDYEAIRDNPRETIDYDWQADRTILQWVSEIGTDGQLVFDRNGALHRANFLEKLLLLAAVKMTNWIPDAGIWLNTQRPEWNDAQNALVGHAASMVTTCYLHRYLVFLRQWLASSEVSCQFDFTSPVAELLMGLNQIFGEELGSYQSTAPETRSARRLEIVDRLQRLGECYRRQIYAGIAAEKKPVCIGEIKAWIDRCLAGLSATIQFNRRDDALYHSYNLLRWGADSIEIENLDEMLEGQVAAMESGIPQAAEVAEILEALRSSRLYRQDQQSYLLYPDRHLPRFNERNQVAKEQAESIPLVRMLEEQENRSILCRDIQGVFHFAADLKNADELQLALDRVANELGVTQEVSPEGCSLTQTDLKDILAADRTRMIALYEQTFQHRQFTGRANTFFAYEGLGSIYWHMVSKLSLAACRHWVATENIMGELASRLNGQFQEIDEGIWFRKNPTEYGAFPTDPYSHTPQHAGAQQPGMTGQVKEDILARQLALGIRIHQGILHFCPETALRREALLEPASMLYFDVRGNRQSLALQPGSFGLLVCQVPVVVRWGRSHHLRLFQSDHRVVDRPECQLSSDESRSLWSRDGRFLKIEVEIRKQ